MPMRAFQDPMTPPAASPPPIFVDHCAESVRELQGALRGAYRSAGLDIEKPQDVSRQIGIDKNLSWKIARIAGDDDALSAASLVPGPEGIGILMDALERGGVGNRELSALRRSFAMFEDMVKQHAGDRPTLQLLLDGVTSRASLELSRKTAFRGQSGVWGVQARVRIMTQLLMPCATDPLSLDTAILGSLIDVRRLRPLTGWPIFRFQRYLGSIESGDQEAMVDQRALEPLEEPMSPEDPALIMRSWCSPPNVQVQSVSTPLGIVHELADGPLGLTGTSTFVFGHLERRAVSRYATDAKPGKGEMGAVVTMPIETLLFDVIAHRDLPEVASAKVQVFGNPFGNAPLDAQARKSMLLPISERVQEITGRPTRFDTEHAPQYPELVSSVFKRIGASPAEFRVFRVEMQYPPMPSTVVVSYDLPVHHG
jgi:hypothetical protein